ncbi:MAG: histidine phosphatase family protein [Planctomycetota bacterium]|nr:histidine phosphatase family protein [Planctomycetota bacterium]
MVLEPNNGVTLVLCRHGNTFDPGDDVVWVGARNDLPLVAKGCEQAQLMADAIIAAGVVPTVIRCGSLSRTHKHADIIARAFDSEAIVDHRLDEIDYGEWSGLTDQQVVARFGEAALARWRDDGVWPQDAGWQPGEDRVTSDVASFVSELRESHESGDIVIAVTSNGRLRYFLREVNGEFERRRDDRVLSVRTGNACRMTLAAESSIERWDVAPSAVWEG